MSIVFAEAERLWLLATPHSAYALRIGADDVPEHVHWGAPLAVPDVVGLPGRGEEFAVEGGVRFGPPSLVVRFADGTSVVEWRYEGHDVDGDTLAVHLAERHYPLRVTLHYRIHDDSDVIERWTTVTNTGTEPISLLRLDSAQWTPPAPCGCRLSHAVGGWSGEHQVRRTEVPVAETVLTSRRGTNGFRSPWLMVDDGSAGEDHGDVWSGALAWSGSWRISLHREPAGVMGWTGGFGHEGLVWSLGEGESLITPVFAGCFSRGGFGAASRAWHAFVRGHVLPRPGELRPVLYNSWEATGFAVDDAGQRELASIAARVGVELFVMDDGWFGARRDDHAGLGDWTPYPAAFPDGLRPLAEHVHGLGMLFGLWVEPEMVNRDSDLYREHPDWVLHQADRRRTEVRNQLVLNFGRADVAEWAFGWLTALVGDHDVDYLKWDCNRPFTEAGPGDRLWVDHVRAVYRIMARLRADHPRLRIESCASGGGRTDIGVLAHTDQVWTSDNTDAVDRLAIQHGFSQVYPAQTMAAWVTDCPNPITGRTTPLEFRFHSAMAGALGIGGDLTRWSTDDLSLAARMIGEYREIRPVVQRGRQYRLVWGGPLTVVEYVTGDDVVVLAWRVGEHYGAPSSPVRLAGLSPVARYTDSRAVYSGAFLTEAGIDLGLPRGDQVSTLIRLRRA
ncbi:MAG TPA: alpha-galactosidase [Pseudonocardiaceae bacterium]|jgi:alpha-galactosidase